MAECLFLRSAAQPGRPATWDRAAETAAAVLVDKYGLDPKAFIVADGSGYSRGNRIAPLGLTALLKALAGEPSFVRSLPICGVDGSLERRLREAPFHGRVAAKTGSIASVSALSGYALDNQGRPALAFSVIVNGPTWAKGHSARTLQDDICRALITWLDARLSPQAAGERQAP